MSIVVVKRTNHLFEAVPNFSEGRDQQLIAALAAEPHVIDTHSDPDHNRTVITLVATDLAELSDALFAMVAQAVERINLRTHTGVHPRVGSADVVPIVPLTNAMPEAAAAARALGERIWHELRVPVYFYGAAALAEGAGLADIRAGRVPPDLGTTPHPTAGIACVGARKPLVAYNIAYSDTQLTFNEARAAAAQLRQLNGVRALAFKLSGGRVQISLNLTEPDQTSAARAYERALELTARTGQPELVGLCPAIAAGPGCDGGLLEARLAAVAARLASEAAARRKGDEMRRMAERLKAEGESLAAITTGQDDLLGAAERAAALARVLDAGGLSTSDLDELLFVAAHGLRRAVTRETAERYLRRVGLLDGWLDSRQATRQGAL